MATCSMLSSSCAFNIVALLIIATNLFNGDDLQGRVSAADVSAGQQVDGMLLGSSWSARNLSYIVSPNKTFCFGWRRFPAASTSFYVAVWYAALDHAIVWVANRDAPASAEDRLKLTAGGNLQLISSTNTANPISWQTNTSGASSIKILDSGNVVLEIGENSSSYAWQSFSIPTDTLLPSQYFPVSQDLISRPPSTSLATGNFMFISPHDDRASIVTQNGQIPIWNVWQPDISHVSTPVRSIDNHDVAAQFHQNGTFIMYNSSTGSSYSQFVPSDYGVISNSTIFRRLTLDSDGNLRMYGWDYGSSKWVVLCEAISDLCGTMSRSPLSVCGAFGVCVNAPDSACACPPGFHPTDPTDVSTGCSPDSSSLPSCDKNNQSSIDASAITYIMLQNTDFFGHNITYKQGIALAQCQDLCTKNCSCVGAIYDPSGSATCWLKEKLENGYSPAFGQMGTGSRVSMIKLWKSTINTSSSGAQFISHPPQISQPSLVWLNSSAFWSQGSVLQPFSTTSPLSPPAAITDSASHRKSNLTLIVSLVSVGEFLCFLLALLLLQKTNLFGHGRSEASAPMQQGGGYNCQAFTYAELVKATNDFRHSLGSGAFGDVFKGILQDGREIAVKRLQTSVLQLAEAQFKAEITTLGRIHHINLLRLYGYCAEGPDHRLLVYEFIQNGSLNSFLFEKGDHFRLYNDDARAEQSREPLDWKTRYNICLGTARGLAYLHDDCLDCIVHCDIKPENILLDKHFSPKVADFGLAYLFGRSETLQVSNVRGTRGYLAPEWLTFNLPITAKADVFSYGMVLLEIVSGCRNFRWMRSDEAAGRWEYPAWAFNQVQNGCVEEVLDPKIRVETDVEYGEVERVLRVAFLCLHKEATARPTMRSIVQMLEGSVPIPVRSHGPGSFQDQVESGPKADELPLLSHVNQRQGSSFSVDFMSPR